MAFNGRFVVNISQLAAKQGADFGELLALSGKPYEELCTEECTLDDDAYNKVLEAAVEQTGDSFFGLHAGENLNLAAAGLIGQITQTSETVKQALEYCCQFANLGCSALPLELIEKKDHYQVTLTPNQLWMKKSYLAMRHTADGVIAFSIREFQSLTREKYNPIEVHVIWDKPENISEYERVLGCPIRFNQEQIAILFDPSHIESKVVTSDYNLLRILVSHAQEKNASLESKNGFVSLVKQSVINLVKPEFPTIEQVAGHLNVSLRTLQRRLKEEGFTFKQLIDELRKDFAISYLKRPDLSIGDVAYLLSYSDVSAFTRSFKRWTGKNPTDFRISG